MKGLLQAKMTTKEALAAIAPSHFHKDLLCFLGFI
jgi:hypothetical protein